MLQILLLPAHDLKFNSQFRERPTHHASGKQTHGDLVGRVGNGTSVDAVVTQLEHRVDVPHGRIGDLRVGPVLEVLFCEGGVIFVYRASGDEVHV